MRALLIALAVAACGGKDEPAAPAPTPADAAPARPPAPPASIDAGADTMMPAAWLEPIAVVDASAACTDDAGCRARCSRKISAACRKVVDLHGGSPEQRSREACRLGDGDSCRTLGDEKRADQLDRAGCDAGDHWACVRHPRIGGREACERGNLFTCESDAALGMGALGMRVAIANCKTGYAYGCVKAVIGARTFWPGVRTIVVPEARRRCDAGEREGCNALMWLLAPVDQAEGERATRAWFELAMRDCGAGELSACTGMLADARWNYRMAVPPEVKDLVGKLAGPAFTWIEARGCQIDLYAHGKERLTEEPCKYVYRAEELLQGFEQSGWMPLPPAPPP